MALTKTLSLNLASAVATGIATAQSGTANTKLTLNGSLVAGGVATLDSGGASRQVIVTSAGNDVGITFAIVGTDRYGRAQTEILAGANGVTATKHDFTTVTSITPSGNTASTVTAGTNTTGSTAPWIVDQWANPQAIGVNCSLTGTATYSIEEAYDDFSPQWDVNTNTPTWDADTNFSAKTSSSNGSLTGGPFTMVRLTITSGTGTVVAKFVQAYAGHTI